MKIIGAIIALLVAGCGLVPRSDYHEGAVISKNYPVDYIRLSGCAFDRLDKLHPGRVLKTDFPDRRTTKLSHTVEAMRVWTIDFIAEGPRETRVVIPIPPVVGATQPERLFSEIEPCGKN